MEAFKSAKSKMIIGSRAFLCLLLAIAPLGYWFGRTLAFVNRTQTSAAVAKLNEKRTRIRSDGLYESSKNLLSKDSKRTSDSKKLSGHPPVWDPWQAEKDITLPLSFFKNYALHIVKSEKMLNEAVLRAIGVPEQQLPVLQEAYSGYNDHMVDADLKHRKLLRNDSDAVEIEIAAYPDEARKFKGEFNSHVKEAIDADKAALLDVMIGMEDAGAENRGLHRRVYKLIPADDGSVRIVETSYRNTVENGESAYGTMGDVPSHLKHLFKIEAGITAQPGNP